MLILSLACGVIVITAVAVASALSYNKSSEANKKSLLDAWKIVIGLFICVPLLLFLLQPLWSKMETDRKDHYGEYVIDREMFKGKQADWQYDHYRFEIKEDITFHFHVTNKERILKTYKGYVSYHAPHVSTRISIHVEGPKHHVIATNPTLVRDIWSFYYVFESAEYGNMFFKKGKWKPID